MTRMFDTKEEMINTYAQLAHNSNLNSGGVFTADPIAAVHNGYEVKEVVESAGYYRMSSLETERKAAAKLAKVDYFGVCKITLLGTVWGQVKR